MTQRRESLKKISTAILGLSVVPGNSYSATKAPDTFKIIVTGAHPDDPETGCGGTILYLKEKGYDVEVFYLTKGEAGIPGKSHEEAANIRTSEAENACRILGVKFKFLGQIDGDCITNNQWYTQVSETLSNSNPDLILTHWPVDTHKDHRACSLLTYQAWLDMKRKPALYYYEVMSGSQTQNFNPTDFVDISKYANIKRKACGMHISQHVEEWYDDTHGKMELFRGIESNCNRAEAFIRHSQSKVFNF